MKEDNLSDDLGVYFKYRCKCMPSNITIMAWQSLKNLTYFYMTKKVTPDNLQSKCFNCGKINKMEVIK